jgi:restriction endonuclease S subunit
LNIALKNIATIKTGVFAKPNSEGVITYLQAKHFGDNWQLERNIHSFLRISSISEKHLLSYGDILFAAKGTNNFAAWYKDKDIPAVASTSFFVIRLIDDFQNKILPEFLAWYINHPISQRFLKARARGTSMVSISKAVLEELKIPIPDLQTQQTILKITHLRKTEKELQQKISMLREKQIQQKIINSIK